MLKAQPGRTGFFFNHGLAEGVEQAQGGENLRGRCPGRHFAEAEVALAVAQLLCNFRLTLRGAAEGENAAGGLLPQPETRRQVGVRWPVAGQPCWVQVSPLSKCENPS